MRLNWSDDESFPGQFRIWQANCRRSLRGKAGQKALRRLEAALLAMPEKALIAGKLVNSNAEVCAIGALAKAEGALPDPDEWPADEDDDDEDDTAEFAEEKLGFPHLVAWKVVEQNDIINDVVWELAHGPLNRHQPAYRGPDGNGYGLAHIRPVTPEERYERVLAWVRKEIIS